MAVGLRVGKCGRPSTADSVDVLRGVEPCDNTTGAPPIIPPPDRRPVMISSQFMPLQPGTTLGPYCVTAKIREVGMGDVWQARATQPDRMKFGQDDMTYQSIWQVGVFA